ncbi:MAG: hypothetical protein ACRD2W_22295 [Acidimicrobiales bacterium]
MSTVATTRFRTTVELGGRTATGFMVPADAVAGLGTRKRRLRWSPSATTRTAARSPSAGTRQRRIDKAVAGLREGRA